MMESDATHSVLYGETEICYQIISREDLVEKIRIHVYPNSSVEVEAPSGESLLQINDAVLKRARWITRQMNQAKKLREFVLPREYISGETHFYLGRRYKLTIKIEEFNGSSVKLNRGNLQVSARVNDPAAIKRRLEQWYFQRADEYIRRRMKTVVEQTDWVETPPPMKLISMQKQWGSLSPDGTVHVNPWLIKAPVDCIEYVLCHELCHLIERNHSRKFYRILKKRLPDWEHRKARLDGMSELILAD